MSEASGGQVRSKRYTDVYEVIPGYALVGIRNDPSSNKLIYEVIEPKVSETEQQLLEQLKHYLVNQWVAPVGLDNPTAASGSLEKAVNEVIKRYKVKIDQPSLQKILYFLKRDFLEYGKITVLLKDPNNEDVACNGVGIPIYVVNRRYGELQTNVVFESEAELDGMIERLAFLANRDISLARPIADGILPNGDRVLVTYRNEVSGGGSTFTIRNVRTDPFTIVDLLRSKTLDFLEAAYVWKLMELKRSVAVIGSTGAGKTTLLNALLDLLDPRSRIITIEETPELRLEKENWVSLHSKGMEGDQSSISLFDLLKASLRQRPDYIIVGEIRGQEAVTFFQAIMTGHGGMTTIHADSMEAMMNRLISPPISVSPALIPAISAVISIGRVMTKNGFVRRVVSVTEITGYDPKTERVESNEYCSWNPTADIVSYNDSKVLASVAELSKVDPKVLSQDLLDKSEYLKWLVNKGISGRVELEKALRSYYKDPRAAIITARLENAEKELRLQKNLGVARLESA